MKRFNAWRNQKGLTLIELLAVIVVLGIIAGIATPAVIGSIENAKKKADENSETIVLAAAERYLLDNYSDEDYTIATPLAFTTLIPKYLSAAPDWKTSDYEGITSIDVTGTSSTGYSVALTPKAG